MIKMLALVYSISVFGQSNDQLFDMLGDETEKRTEKKTDNNESQSFTQALGKNMSAKLIGRTMIHHRDPKSRQSLDLRNYFWDARLEFDTNYSSKSSTVLFSGWIEGGNQQNTYEGVTEVLQDTNRHRHHIELNELHYTSSGETTDFSIGKKIIKLGSSTLFSPSNRFSPAEANDPLNPKEMGAWYLGLDYYFGDSTLSFKVMPVFTPSKLPHESSRWYTVSADGLEAQLDDASTVIGTNLAGQLLKDEYPETGLDNAQFLATYKTTLSGWDVFLGAYIGFSSFPVLREDQKPGGQNEYVKEYVPVTNLMGGFSTTSGKFEVHAETFLNSSKESKDDDYILSVAGFTYTIDELFRFLGVEKMDVTLEYVGEHRLKDQSNANYLASSRALRIIRNNILWRLIIKASEDFTAFHGGNFEAGPERGVLLGFGFQYRLFSGLMSKLAYEYFDGQKDSFFGRWRRNKRIIAQFEYNF